MSRKNHQAAEQSGLPASFSSECWARRPHFFVQHPAPLAAQACSFEHVDAMMYSMPAQDIIYRGASGGVAASMPRLSLPDWRSLPLEQRLAGETTSLMLQNVQLYDSGFRSAVAQLIDWLARELDVRASDFRYATTSIFLSSPRAISSYHTDREQNFLYHLHGTKTMHVFPRRIDVAQEILQATFRARKGIHFEYDPKMEENCRQFELHPGNTLYVPRNWPHWVENGAQVAMSLSINLFRPGDFLLERIYLINDALRARLAGVGRMVRHHEPC